MPLDSDKHLAVERVAVKSTVRLRSERNAAACNVRSARAGVGYEQVVSHGRANGQKEEDPPRMILNFQPAERRPRH